MKPFRVGRWLCALVLTATGAAPVQAAWDNVFQVCCNSCRSRPFLSRFNSSGYAPTTAFSAATAACCPQTTCCTTQYVQRCFYQPVTCYQSKSYYEPVTTYKTSYYYEPVTSYRYSCYFDPCTCSYQQVACPQTCYRLRSQTCAVTSYLQRTCQVPVTSYRLSYYYEPVTSCYNPCSQPCPQPCAQPCEQQQPAAAAPQAFTPQPATPGVQEQANPAAPGVQENRAPATNPGAGNGYDRYYPPSSTNPPPTSPPPSGSHMNRQQGPTPPPPTVKLDRIVSLPTPPADGLLQGQVVHQDNLPRSNVQLTFVRADANSSRQAATADRDGKFAVNLPSGGWHVYLTGNDGRAVYLNQIEVRGEQNRPIVLVSH
ncbi:MAG: carboxypeptidase regulatory-like domain-containing protein [Planctomycetia bacterium]|nr:carboxypeptidase regulatory-like domain-containing protein [Planctomycetia bacterium]